ncbi:MAG: hypothetical protein A3B99_00120 [Candidatus Yanofskybacteria bacterium RIFCSPHIGHO2_02_FULL_44_12b]|uniref:Uncharacterized protein n=2 Tax=Candidatus Yanofskyibacteriota TaxID=1752733 RepID=A0A1F8GKF0_9BACT|nr:MAG: hypothetical protein UW79_C0013G0012 [Candidatus Yanofskybacteria bacterium GW2011_GWA2_44_9]OGN04158.1 MAG: hypothetical protein A2659_01565 [Candidatus Yanofskybacteria bacterium RIFCSPHIGHO2_01_FULL_44_24]OGN14752.1 MAG: hypothetical protein A3B99_00120 [Candidatus Yanofskybacteria bacterium RIFCSPHIGHO2_02_FULL_44_12b]OGN25884.1 MAG: hypothetical protein A2925_02485 [Candidatus Yanofskybacteria bacterium RIFCSPLOWO2_01_FULL_44_22]
MKILTNKKVYYVFCPDDPTVLVAMDIKLTDSNTITWLDTVKERSMTIERVAENVEDRFVFDRSQKEGGGTYTFVPMTLAIYNDGVKSHLLSPGDFESEEKMIEAFEKTRSNIW